MKKRFLWLIAIATAIVACSPEEVKPDPSQEPSSEPVVQPSDDPSAGPVIPPVVEGKVVLNGKTGYNTFSEALEAAKTAKTDAEFTFASGTLAENILLDGKEIDFPITIKGRAGAVLDGSIEISAARVALENFSIIPATVKVEKPAIEIKDRSNYPFAVFVHDASYGFSMENVTIDISALDKDATAVVMRGETVGEEGKDLVKTCTLKGNGQRMMQLYDAQVDILGNQFENFYSGYAIRIGEDLGKDVDGGYYDNECGPTVTLAGNTFSSNSTACVNFYSVWTSTVTFGNGETDTNLKGDDITYYYTADSQPGSECIWIPDMLFDPETKELYPAQESAMPEAELVWAKRADDSWWTTDPLPGFFNEAGDRTLDWNRSVAMDDQYVYMPRQQGGETVVYYFPINDPSQVKTLDMTGVTTDATHTVSSCQVVDDGNGGTALLVSNLARNGQDFKVYKWTGVASAPEVILNYSTWNAAKTGAARLGDKFSFNGTLQDGEVVTVNYDVGGRFWIFPVKGGLADIPEGYFGENGWTSDFHQGSNIVGGTRFPGTDAYLLWGANLLTTITSIWMRGSEGMGFAGSFPDYVGMFDPQFFTVGRSKYMAYASLTDVQDNKYYSTIRIVRILKNADGADSPYVTMTDSPSDGGLVLGIGQASAMVPVMDANTNGNMVAGCCVRQIGGVTYVLGSDTNNALVLYRLK